MAICRNIAASSQERLWRSSSRTRRALLLVAFADSREPGAVLPEEFLQINRVEAVRDIAKPHDANRRAASHSCRAPRRGHTSILRAALVRIEHSNEHDRGDSKDSTKMYGPFADASTGQSYGIKQRANSTWRTPSRAQYHKPATESKPENSSFSS